MDLNIENSRSYDTEAQLVRFIKVYGFEDCRYVIVKNRLGRFTAIFPISLNSKFVGGNVTIFARRGFMTLN